MTDQIIREAQPGHAGHRRADGEQNLAAFAGGTSARRAGELHAQGLIRLEHGDLGGAADYFRAALVTQAEHVESWRQLGEIALRRGDRASAVSHLAQVLSLEPRDTGARQRLAEVLATGGTQSPGETA
jgi:cytochrome c-type biogenesis protein CcmH/NrfG